MKAPIALFATLLLAGCYAAPTSTRLPATTGAVTSQAESAATAGARMANTAAAAGTRTAAACPDPVGVLTGYVYDQDRQPIAEGATIQVVQKGNGAQAPFTATVAVIGGVYSVSQLPVGVELEVSAVSKGGFVRTRTLTLTGNAGCDEAEALRTSLNFGGAANSQDPRANLFYLPR
jgi:hypothetical protein